MIATGQFTITAIYSMDEDQIEKIESQITQNTETIKEIDQTVNSQGQQILSKVSQTDFDNSINGIKTDTDLANRGIGKWLVEVYPKTTLPNENCTKYTLDAFWGQDISPDRILEVDDDSAKMYGNGLFGDNLILYYLTYVYFNAAASVSTSFYHDDGGTLYLNGKTINSSASAGSVTVTLPFKAGWNILEVVVNEYTSTEGFKFTTPISQNASCKSMNCYIARPTLRQMSQVDRITQINISLDTLTQEVTANGLAISKKADGESVTNLQILANTIKDTVDTHTSEITSVQNITATLKTDLNEINTNLSNYASKSDLTSSIDQSAGVILETVSSKYETTVENTENLSRGLNKWIVEVYPKSGVTNSIIPTPKEVLGITPTRILEYTESSLTLTMNLGDTYIGHAQTYVYFKSDYNFATSGNSITLTTLGNGIMYINGAEVKRTTANTSTIINTGKFVTGWNVIEVWWASGTGNDGIKFSNNLTELTGYDTMNCYQSFSRNAYQRITAAEIESKVTNDDAGNTKYSSVVQNADKISWLVNSGTSSSNFTLTDRVASLLSSKFNIDALTTFKNSAENGTSTVIDGGAIITNTINTNSLKAGTGGNLYALGYDTFEQIPNNASSIFYGSARATISISNDTSYYGTKSLKITSTGDDAYVYLGNSTNGYGCIPVIAGKFYCISCYAKSTTSTSTQLYVVGHTAKNATNSAHNSATTIVTTTWTRLELAYTATSTYPYISIRIDNDTSDTTLYIDAIQIEEVPSTSHVAGAFSPAGTTLIDGGQIYTNSITADKINVTALEAIAAKIGGFTIADTALYNGPNSLSSTTAGVYLGINGINISTANRASGFYADSAGKTIVTSNTLPTGVQQMSYSTCNFLVKSSTNGNYVNYHYPSCSALKYGEAFTVYSSVTSTSGYFRVGATGSDLGHGYFEVNASQAAADRFIRTNLPIYASSINIGSYIIRAVGSDGKIGVADSSNSPLYQFANATHAHSNLVLQRNGTTAATYTGASAITFNITPANIGAALSVHKHSKLEGTTSGAVELTAEGNWFRSTVDNKAGCGSTSYRWTRVYAVNATISTSDEKEKADMKSLDTRYEKMFFDLQPILYKWKNFSESDMHDRIHCGLGAQTTLAAARKHGLDEMTFAAICRDTLEEPTADGRMERYGIAYSELHGLEIHMIQKCFRELESLRAENKELSLRLENLANQNFSR